MVGSSVSPVAIRRWPQLETLALSAVRVSWGVSSHVMSRMIILSSLTYIKAARLVLTFKIEAINFVV